MAGRLAGATAIVSGGATGMGRATSLLFGAEGAKVAVIDKNEPEARRTVEMIRKNGGVAEAWIADVSDEGSVNDAVKAVEGAFGAAKVLFNHAGTIIIKPFLEISVEEWDWLTGVNVRSMFLMTRAVLPNMIKNGGGSIICTSSISAVAATPMEVLYDTTKGAVHMFARAIAVEFRDRGVRCNAVCPGFVRTPHGEREISELGAGGVNVSEAMMKESQGRIGEPEDIAHVVLFLASDESRFVTGARIFVDNGFTAI